MNIYRNIENQLRTTYLKNTLGRKKAALNVNAMVCTYMVLMISWYFFYLSYPTPCCNSYMQYWADIPAAIYDDNVGIQCKTLTVYFNHSGRIYFSGRLYESTDQLDLAIKKNLGFYSFDKTKIKLKVDRLTPFGKVQAFLRAARKASVREFCFITVPRAGLIDFMGRERLNLKKK